MSTTLRQPGLEFKLCLIVLGQAIFGVGTLWPLVQSGPFKILTMAVLGFRIALRDGSQWSRSVMH